LPDAMPQYSWVFSTSYNRFEIRSHDTVYATHFRESVNLINRGAFVSERVLEGLDRDIDTDFVTVFETIGNRLSGVVDADRNAFNGLHDNPLGERFTGKTNNSERWGLQRWTACFVVYCNPDLVRVLGSEVMKPECGEQANDGMRNDFSHDCK
jgi:hypothetical protein